MKTLNIKTYQELKKLYTSLSDKHIFRGQADSSWNINSTLYRNKFISKKALGEEQMLNSFGKSIHLYEKNGKTPDGKVEKLAYLQHYGAPTRLIDFTYSPYIATYFAFKDSKDKSSVFVIDYNALVEANIKYIEGFKKNNHDELISLLSTKLSAEQIEKIIKIGINNFHRRSLRIVLKPDENKAVDKLFSINKLYIDLSNILSNSSYSNSKDEEYYSFLFENDKITNVIIKVEPFYQNLRRISQSGCFLCQNNIDISFDETLTSLSKFLKVPVLKINIPIALRKEILLDLNKMNISESSMFPELDGFIRSLGFSAENS